MQKLKKHVEELFPVKAIIKDEELKFTISNLSNAYFHRLYATSEKFKKSVLIKRSGTGLTVILS